MKKHTLITEKAYSYGTEYHGTLFNSEERDLSTYGYSLAGGILLLCQYSTLWGWWLLLITLSSSEQKLRKALAKEELVL